MDRGLRGGQSVVTGGHFLQNSRLDVPEKFHQTPVTATGSANAASTTRNYLRLC